VNRLIRFLRSVIPQDPAQLLFLVGSTLLLICMQLRCIPLSQNYAPGSSTLPSYLFDDQFARAQQSWLIFSICARLPIVFAGAAGLFICFRPGPRPLRRSLLFVCLPSIAGLALLCSRFLTFTEHWNSPPVSIFEHRIHSQSWVLHTWWSMGPALHMSVLGIALVLIFLSRQALGLTSLPLSLPHSDGSALHIDGGWKRIEILVWTSMIGIFLVNLVTGALFLAAYGLEPRVLNFPALVPVMAAVGIGLLVFVAAWAVGENRSKDFKEFIRLSGVKLAVFAVAIPVAINLIPNFVAYVFDRIQWGIHGFGQYSPPIFARYFQFPAPFYFWYFPGAFLEEIIWRGYLQPRFVERYGALRGIFLIGLSWSASHFVGDFQGTRDDFQIPMRLVMRLALCVTMSYVLGWLTMRSGSIWPAVLVHGLHNVWAFSSASYTFVQDPLLNEAIIRVCYGFLGYALFKYWPPAGGMDDSERTAADATELPA